MRDGSGSNDTSIAAWQAIIGVHSPGTHGPATSRAQPRGERARSGTWQRPENTDLILACELDKVIACSRGYLCKKLPRTAMMRHAAPSI